MISYISQIGSLTQKTFMITLCGAYCLLNDNVLLNCVNTHMALNKQTHRYISISFIVNS